jgi:hypothetical protein
VNIVAKRSKKYGCWKYSLSYTAMIRPLNAMFVVNFSIKVEAIKAWIDAV